MTNPMTKNDDDYDDELDEEFYAMFDRYLEKRNISQNSDDYTIVDGPAW